MKILAFLLLFLPGLAIAGAYWQQDVHYKIDASLDPKQHRVEGNEELIYKNNSPDVLDVVYFHLYWNLFTEGSRGQELARRNKSYEFDTSGGISLTRFVVSDGSMEYTPGYVIDNTLMEVRLPYHLHPGDSIVFRCSFEEKIPGDGWRAGHQGRDYNIAQWYPQIAVYDKYGWDKSQYLGSAEFFLEYGRFDVNITIPKSFTLGYTGVLLNPADVYPDSIQRRLAESASTDSTIRIADFSEKEWSRQDTALVTWKFHAENVRDFAWTANEHYIWDVAHWKPDPISPAIAVHALYFSDKAEYWKDAAHMGRHAVSFFSTHYGLYAYPNMFVVEGVVGGGMEYPGIVFIGHHGSPGDHYFFGVITHEVGHSWYPMMIGSNETYFPFMDEGFNTFITTTAVEDYYGRYNNSYEWNAWYQRLLHYPNDDDRRSNQRSSLWLSRTGFEDPIATHAYRFKEDGLAGTSIYAKTASVMFMLQYVLGDSVFENVMKEYYHRWKFRHPYPEDFYTTAEEASGKKDLRWFFDEWFDRTYRCDYEMDGLSSRVVQKENGKLYRTTVSVRRNERAIMPVDVRILLADGSHQTVWFPIDRWLNAEVKNDTVIDLPARPVDAEINPDGRILDINRLNNRSSLPKVDFQFDNTMFSVSPLDAYLLRLRPSAWYTDQGGWNFGYKLSGSYLEDLYRLSAYQLFNTRDNTMNYDVELSHSMYEFSPLSSVSLRYYRLEGRKGASVVFEQGIRRDYSHSPFHTLRAQYSYSQADNSDYLLAPSIWEPGNLQRVLLSYFYTNRGDGWHVSALAGVEASARLLGRSDYVYTKRTLEIKSTITMPAHWDFALRLFDGIGVGDIPSQSKFYFASASPLEEFNAPLMRSKGPLPSTVRDHALYPGGGNMRGYFNIGAGSDEMEAVNVEARFQTLIPFASMHAPVLSKLSELVHSRLFLDAGRIVPQSSRLWDQRFELDCGFGFRLSSLSTIFGPFSDSNLLSGIGLYTIRVDFPIYVSRPIVDENKLKFRWVVSFGESF